MSTSSSALPKRKKDKAKKQKPSAPVPPTTGKNEGIDQNWAFQPPPGTKPVSINGNNGEFDWDAVKEDEDVELWVLRVPENVQPKHLEGLSLDLHSSTRGKPKTARIGSLKRKRTSYDIWSLGDDGTVSEKDASSADLVGGEELKSLSCLLPRKSKKGKFYIAPKPITRHIVVSAQHIQPSASDLSPTNDTMYKNPQRHKYPVELLTHRFMPYGSLANTGQALSSSPMDVDPEVGTMEVDDNVLEPVEKERKSSKKKKGKIERVKVEDGGVGETKTKQKTEKKEKKSKKRKGEDAEGISGSSKKSKKPKTTS